MDRILVLDGEARSALAVVRSLGRLAVEVGVASCARPAIAQRSRFASCSFRCPDPGNSPEPYQRWLLETVKRWKPHMVLPLTDISLDLALRIESPLRECTVLPTVSAETFERVSNKSALLAAATELGVRTPATVRIPPKAGRSPETYAKIERFAYPAVMKTSFTQSDCGDRFVRAPIVYPKHAGEVRALIDGDGPLSDVEVLLQQRIEGPGTAVFALCADGRPVALFAHRRLLEKPPTGGVSVLSEGVALERAPVAEAVRLLEHFRWQGMAMVEFKQHRDGRFYLMEINPRFWGSLQLAVDSGRDFPALLYRLFRSGEPLRGEKLDRFAAEVPDYMPGRRLRWLLGTLDHFLIRLKQGAVATLRDTFILNSLSILRSPVSTRLEVLRWVDPAPFAAEVRAWVRALRGD